MNELRIFLAPLILALLAGAIGLIPTFVASALSAESPRPVNSTPPATPTPSRAELRQAWLLAGKDYLAAHKICTEAATVILLKSFDMKVPDTLKDAINQAKSLDARLALLQYPDNSLDAIKAEGSLAQARLYLDQLATYAAEAMKVRPVPDAKNLPPDSPHAKVLDAVDVLNDELGEGEEAILSIMKRHGITASELGLDGLY